MTLVTLQIPEALEQKLHARARGRDIATVALELVEQGLNQPAKTDASPALNRADWLKELDEWLSSRPRIDVVLDDSRETIYEGR